MSPKEQWPTPSFDLANVVYECGGCGCGVAPKHGHKQAAVLIAGMTLKLCEDCARDAIEAVAGGDET